VFGQVSPKHGRAMTLFHRYLTGRMDEEDISEIRVIEEDVFLSLFKPLHVKTNNGQICRCGIPRNQASEGINVVGRQESDVFL